MSRVLLVVPPNALLNGAPALGTCCLAAALVKAGHDVTISDLGAPYGPREPGLARKVGSWRPDIVGVSLFTEVALETYGIVARLGPLDALLVAGGVHATAVPAEPLAHGFDLTVRGEGEQTLVALADALDRGGREGLEPGEIAGLTWRDPDGAVQHAPDRPLIADLDQLAPRDLGAGLFRRKWYVPWGQGALPASLMTSRGCPGRCIFCSRLVTGGAHRAHSVERILAEMQAHIDREGPAVFAFHDDAFTADRERLEVFCAALKERFSPAPAWWCESRVDHMDDEAATLMAGAGCRVIAYGVESGDPETLRKTGKGITPEASIRALEATRRAGIRTQVNMMFGFPHEDASHMANNLAFIERIAPVTSAFTPLGIPLPYPGTALYKTHRRAYGFEGWWLDARVIQTLRAPLAAGGYAALPPDRWPALSRRLEEAVLRVDFFRYSAAMKDAIRACLEARSAHNLATSASG